MSPKLRGPMKRAKVWWDRFHCEHDTKISRICHKLWKHKLIDGFVVDKNHITNVVKKNRSHAIPITHPQDFVEVFDPSELGQVNPIIQEFFPTPPANILFLKS